MPISADQAADVAKRHGLTLHDAAGLLNLAENVEDAERIAGRFAAVDPDAAAEAERRAYVGRLFGRKEPAEDDVEPPKPGVVPAEGANPDPLDDQERSVRRFVAELFDHPDRDHR